MNLKYALIPLIMLLTSCGGNLGSFTFTEESQEALVMGGGNGLLEQLPTQNLLPPLSLDINLENELEQQDAGPAQAVYLDALSLDITPTSEPGDDTDNFDFIDSVDVFVESTQNNSSLMRQKIAELKDVPTGQRTVDFTIIEGIDLKPYVEEGVRLTTEGSGEVPPDDTSLKAVVTIRVDLL